MGYRDHHHISRADVRPWNAVSGLGGRLARASGRSVRGRLPTSASRNKSSNQTGQERQIGGVWQGGRTSRFLLNFKRTPLSLRGTTGISRLTRTDTTRTPTDDTRCKYNQLGYPRKPPEKNPAETRSGHQATPVPSSFFAARPAPLTQPWRRQAGLQKPPPHHHLRQHPYLPPGPLPGPSLPRPISGWYRPDAGTGT